MQQNATPDTLTPAQEKALAALLAGKSVTDVATVAGVDRSTVHRWLKDDFSFQAALNRGRRDLREVLQARLMKLAEKAADCVESSMKAGNSKTALAVLKGLGLLSGSEQVIGSSDPAELDADARRRQLFSNIF